MRKYARTFTNGQLLSVFVKREKSRLRSVLKNFELSLTHFQKVEFSNNKKKKQFLFFTLSNTSHILVIVVQYILRCLTYLEFYPRPCPTRNTMHHRGFIAANLECDDATFSNGPFYNINMSPIQKEKVKIGVQSISGPDHRFSMVGPSL